MLAQIGFVLAMVAVIVAAGQVSLRQPRRRTCPGCWRWPSPG
jgi:hypothetical protein